jgi:hypothetical protein
MVSSHRKISYNASLDLPVAEHDPLCGTGLFKSIHVGAVLHPVAVGIQSPSDDVKLIIPNS